METIQSDQLGTVQVESGSVIRFADGIPGFEEYHDYVLVEAPEAAPFEWLQSTEEPALAFAVVDPQVICPGYAPRFGRGDLASIGLEAADHGLLRVILTLSDDPEQITANLQAPLVINQASGLGCQVLLTRSDYDTRYRVVEGIA